MTEHDRGGESFEANLQAADDLAAAAMQDNKEPAPAALEAPAARGRRLGPIVTAVCLVIVASQLPAMRAAFKETPSIRVGVAAGDEDTDACIDTLWKISSLLQERKFQGSELLEPSTQQPYVVRESGGDTTVACPNPASHSLRSLHVSSSHRAPEAKR